MRTRTPMDKQQHLHKHLHMHLRNKQGSCSKKLIQRTPCTYSKATRQQIHKQYLCESSQFLEALGEVMHGSHWHGLTLGSGPVHISDLFCCGTSAVAEVM